MCVNMKHVTQKVLRQSVRTALKRNTAVVWTPYIVRTAKADKQDVYTEAGSNWFA